MVDIQCSSCHTRYRIDERVLPEETPTFKCSRCGHVFSVEPRQPAESKAEPKVEPKPESGIVRSATADSEEPKASSPRREKPKPASAAGGEPKAHPAITPEAGSEAKAPGETSEPAGSPEPAAPAESAQAAASAKPAEGRARRGLKVVPPARESVARESVADDAPRAAAAGAAPSERKPKRQAAAKPRKAAETVPFDDEPEHTVEASEPLASDDPLAHPFSDRLDYPEPVDSSSFDFSNETEEHEADAEADSQPDEDQWEVGDDVEPAEDFDTELRRRIAIDRAAIDRIIAHKRESGSPESEAPSEPRSKGHPQAQTDQDETDPQAPFLGRAVHSSGFFMAAFFFVALGFGALSLLIAGEPAASASLLSRLPAGLGDRFVNPLTPALEVSLREVHAEYQSISGGGKVLVITGQAANVGRQPLHQVQIGVSLLDGSQQELARQAVYCGNNLSGRMIGQMTPREVDFFQKLGPPKTFVLQPSSASDFAIVFAEPPAHAGQFAIQVEQAERAVPAPNDAAVPAP